LKEWGYSIRREQNREGVWMKGVHDKLSLLLGDPVIRSERGEVLLRSLKSSG